MCSGFVLGYCIIIVVNSTVCVILSLFLLSVLVVDSISISSIVVVDDIGLIVKLLFRVFVSVHDFTSLD